MSGTITGSQSATIAGTGTNLVLTDQSVVSSSTGSPLVSGVVLVVSDQTTISSASGSGVTASTITDTAASGGVGSGSATSLVGVGDSTQLASAATQSSVATTVTTSSQIVVSANTAVSSSTANAAAVSSDAESSVSPSTSAGSGLSATTELSISIPSLTSTTADTTTVDGQALTISSVGTTSSETYVLTVSPNNIVITTLFPENTTSSTLTAGGDRFRENDFSLLRDRFPTVIPFDEIRITETHTFRVVEDDSGNRVVDYVYILDKAPFENVENVTATVNDTTTELEKGVDYAVIDTNDSGNPDAIDFSVGGEQPDDNTDFDVTYVAESVISRYIGEYEGELNTVDIITEDVIDSHQVEEVDLSDLDQIGKLFGELGKRRNRSDKEYKNYLTSIVEAFNGRGSVSGIKFSVAGAVGVQPEDVEVVEEFERNAYRINITDDTVSPDENVIRELAELADPSGIGYKDIITYDDLGSDLIIASGTFSYDKKQIIVLGKTDLGDQTLGNTIDI